MAWKVMLGYLPTNASRRQQTLERKREEYRDAIAQHYDIDDDSRTIQEQETLRQVLVDVPRTAPDIPLFRNEKIRRALARLLYIWAMRHPASSYVQGINDLATPLVAVFLSDYYEGQNVLDGNVMVVLSDERLEEASRLRSRAMHQNTPKISHVVICGLT
jgi:TBC1 domain family member 2